MEPAVEHRPRMTPELVRHVAEFSPLSTVLRLVLLNKDCHRSTISIIYQAVTITSTDQLERFSDALFCGEPSLRLCTRSLHIRATGDYSLHDLHAIPSDIHTLLLVTDNLTELTLDLHSSNPNGPAGSLSLDAYDAATWEPDLLLPNLRSLTARAGTICTLARGRPISKICFISSDPIPTRYLGTFISAIPLASAPLVCLKISIFARDLGESALVLAGLSYCCKSLEDLTIRITHSTTPSHEDVVSALANMCNLGGLLRQFTVLRTIVFEAADFAVRLAARQLTALEVQRFSSWKENCPSLESISLFDYFKL
ncbi:hypothetical protein FS749_004062 [Ceratobasidium sp. UAMH 11750]|nr:hypothetical protein FS749_004062 [Ceratobasidium sp. UAMH 11750]